MLQQNCTKQNIIIINMRSTFSRRKFLKVTFVMSGALMAFHASGNKTLFADNKKGKKNINHWNGSLVKDPDTLFDLPSPLHYKEIMQTGNLMSDGLVYGGDPDGMEFFQLDKNRLALIINHETTSPDKSLDVSKAYDTINGIPYSGGTSTLILNPETLEVDESFRSLSGTIKNCAGGKTPWNTWISCEETYQEKHGYAFEVDPRRDSKGYKRLSGMGRFKREAVAVDVNDKKGSVYQTEDDPTGLFYKFVPKLKNKLDGEGKLYALSIKGLVNANNSKREIKIGDSLKTSWVSISDPEAASMKTKLQGRESGATTFNGSEGIIVDINNLNQSEIFFTCKSGGFAGLGQIWRYNPSNDYITLFYESSSKDEFWMGDNITISPWGDLIVCEDNDSNACKLIGFTPKGKLYVLGKVSSKRSTEISGVCFSPDGTKMGLNLQHEGKTIIISGDWDKIKAYSRSI